MKMLQIPHVSLPDLAPWDKIGEVLSEVPAHNLSEAPWEAAFPYRPDVTFQIAYTDNSILMRYYVREQHLQGKYRQTNDPVHLDSCVEFFVSWDSTTYYNLEFNCMGTAHVGFGEAKHLGTRQLLDRNKVATIRTKSTINAHDETCGTSSWELLLQIPFDLFAFHEVTSLKGKVLTGNFYKCGDELPKPHYLSWTNISAPSPNFHLPEYFGQLHFA